MTPGGVRIGTPALTSRGLMETDFEKIADFLHKAVLLALDIQKNSGKQLAEFKAALSDKRVKDLRKQVEDFAEPFPIPGQ